MLKLSELITKKAIILEADSRGAKALLYNNKIYKVFYNTRHPIRGRLFPKSKQFATNCKKLNNRGFTAPIVDHLYFDNEIKTEMLSYPCITGKSARQLISNNKLASDETTINIIKKIANLMANLHQKGVLFRSFHLGNIIIDIQNEYINLALIDVADLKCFPFPLLSSQRIRNFKHLTRVVDDKHLFDKKFIKIFINEYQLASKVDNAIIEKIEQIIQI